MGKPYDLLVVGAGPGGLAAGVLAREAGLSHLIIEKGHRPLQGIVDSYPRGKRVYPTVPRGEKEPFAVPGLAPPPEKIPVEAYVENVAGFVRNQGLDIRFEETFQGIDGEHGDYRVKTDAGTHGARNVVLAFGSNIPNDLGVYGEARTVARNLENVSDYIGTTTLVIGGGNAAADIVAALSRAKREAGDSRPVYWAHIREQFDVNKNAARDLGEEILLGGQIRILQGAVPKIGEVDDEGIDRLYIHQGPGAGAGRDVFVYQGMSFPMRNVIACVGTHGPSAVFSALDLQQITCTGTICRIAKEGEALLLLTGNLETSRRSIYAVGGSISPSYMEVGQDGSIREKKHSNLIYTAIQDAARVVGGILSASDPKNAAK